MPIKNADLHEFHRLCTQEGDVESALRYLRARGYTKGVSIAAFRMAGVADHKSAKLMVHESDAWSDVRVAHEEFHDVCFDALKDLGLLDGDSAEDAASPES